MTLCSHTTGLKLCFGEPVDPELLELVHTEVAELKDLVKFVEENTENILNILEAVEKSLKNEIQELKERQLRTEKDVEQLKDKQDDLQVTISKLRNEKEPRYLFMAPKQSVWFSGRKSELGYLRDVLENKRRCGEEGVLVAAISGLGGCGKTSLTAEYIHKWKGYYQGGVYWFSAESDVKFKASVDEIAAQFDTLYNDSFNVTLYKTLAVFSHITKPWLVVVDNMDEADLSPNLVNLVSGPWQENVACFGRLIITTRRTPQDLEEQLSGIEESNCLKLECFGSEEAKEFVFRRTNITRDEQKELSADSLCQKLGGLPLALEQACAYIKYLGCSLSEYLGSYEEQSLQLLNKKKATSFYGTSPERLAVRTTWRLNFEHIKKDENGIVATRFLNASAFFDRNEIQKDLINVGDPLVDDKIYCDYVSSSLGSLEVLKLLTDFSLFKETHDSSLTVHRLVQEVIRESLTSEEKVESIVDAARLLRFAFLQCPSPDKISESVVTEYGDRPSLYPNDSSNFYKWHKLCLHAHEIRRNLERLLEVVSDVTGKTVFLTEIARVVYECALHLNVSNLSSRAKIVGDFAHRILDWNRGEILGQDLKALFPHIFPLSERLRRLIQYSCKAPTEGDNSLNSTNTSNTSVNDSLKTEIENMRLEGNTQFIQSNFQEAIERYSLGIDKSKGKQFFDPRLLSNRASAYLRLMQYENALDDAEEYIKDSPECSKGHARKAVALQGLNEKWDAMSAASLAFYHDRKIFDKYEPFKTTFPKLKECIHICDETFALLFLLSQCQSGDVSGMPIKIIVLEPGDYTLSTRLDLENVILVGVGDHVTLSFTDDFGLLSGNFMAVNISFVFNVGNWSTKPKSEVKVFKCSVTSKSIPCALLSSGNLMVKNSIFRSCEGNALVVQGKAWVEDSEFSASKSIGLQVVGFANLQLKNSKLYGNQWGLDVQFGTCNVTGCQIYDNMKIGVGVGNGGKVKLTQNEIFHNDRHGVCLIERSSAVIEKNEIFQNGWHGISTLSDASCVISNNSIYQNKCGGIHAAPVSRQQPQSVIEFNKISGNEGPGIDQMPAYADSVNSPFPTFSNDEVLTAKCTGNILEENISDGMPPPSQNLPDICWFCRQNVDLKKCTKCFVSGYCKQECQKADWEHHKKECARILEKHSVLVKILPLSLGLKGDKSVVTPEFEYKAPFKWLEPSGPEYEKAPTFGKRFIVKVQACDVWRKSNYGGAMLAIEDRSQTINGDLDMNDEQCFRIYNLVRECGSNCNSYGWKKKFLWALLAKGNKVRVFTSDFPPYQRW
ncbi:uncharacterized protein LOC114531338 isoform X2 [Dendronephthya gigantea]|uniref:uncharacterized protein LOC114531338 isoform X2 n=1 Tax=Dendronephthya gigantea TaxID=151771 RepID=UPI00106A6ED5|nr:uncharacterized protein LOC114531338 isoform X2 [Dendronephthya gigantea]